MKYKMFIFCFIFSSVFAVYLRADNMIRYVSLAGSSSAPYTNWTMAATNFADGVDATPNNGTLYVAPGVYYATRDIIISGKTITITGLDGSAETIYDGGGQSLHGINVSLNSTVYIKGLTITNFYFPDDTTAGEKLAFYIHGLGVANLDSCVIAGNTAWSAGGIYLNGRLFATNSIVRGNTARRGGIYSAGAIYAVYGTELVMDNCYILDNISSTSAGIGGARDLVLRNCLFSGNGPGRGLYVFGAADSQKLIENSRFIGNTGGGIFVRADENLTIRNSLIAHNSAAQGAGIYAVNADLFVHNCTVVSNHASSTGGGLYLNNYSTNIMVNTVCYHNTGGAYSNFYANHSALYGTATAYITNCIIAPNPPPSSAYVYTYDCISNDPELEDFRPGRRSPCINAGIYESWMDTALDLDGNPRILDGTVDIGAFEHVPPPFGTIFRFR